MDYIVDFSKKWLLVSSHVFSDVSISNIRKNFDLEKIYPKLLEKIRTNRIELLINLFNSKKDISIAISKDNHIEIYINKNIRYKFRSKLSINDMIIQNRNEKIEIIFN
jgi:3-polyprenyl-4-hydroxybenzoate decarboxylase